MRYIFLLLVITFCPFLLPLQAQETNTDSLSTEWKKTFFSEQLLVQADSGNIETVAFLLKNGADPNIQTWDGITPLMYATQTGRPQLVTLLLLKGANPNAKPVDGNTALHTATYLNLDTIAEILIKYGAEIDAANSYNVTPLHNAVVNGYPYLTSLMLYYGATPHTTDIMGNSTVMMAAYVGATSTLDILLKEGVDPNIADHRGYTPLMAAAQFNDTLIIQKLLEYDADPFKKNGSGNNALSIAIYHGASDAAKLLIELNADSLSNEKRNNYLQLAKEAGLNDIYTALKEKGYKKSIKPRVSQISPYVGMLFGNKEFMFEGGISLFETLSKTHITLGYAIRPRARTAEVFRNNRIYQLKEKRSIFTVGIEKEFGSILLKNDKSLSLLVGLKGAYSWGNFKGTALKADSKFMLIPSFGILYRIGAVNTSFTGEYIKLRETSNNHLRVSIKLAVPIRIGKYKIKPKQIKWLQ
ncbi:MAG: ankyrin repeat domain-containing protein [Bacteroidales bacterium]|nr:ankyrin repeat domain-containing protein [Bacteroidales bacterium]MBN2748637.1 ankyrin repeat domain-containing protein [Bacteroidales bacterium]